METMPLIVEAEAAKSLTNQSSLSLLAGKPRPEKMLADVAHLQPRSTTLLAPALPGRKWSFSRSPGWGARMASLNRKATRPVRRKAVVLKWTINPNSARRPSRQMFWTNAC